MSSIKSKSEITLESIEIANEIKSYTDKNKCLTLLYNGLICNSFSCSF